MIAKIIEELTNLLGDDYEISAGKHARNNETLTGVTIRRTQDMERVAPIFYLDKMIKEKGATPENIARRIVDLYHNIDTSADALPDKINADFIRETLRLRAVGVAGNDAFLENIPYKRVEDMALFLTAEIGEVDDGKAILRITNDILDYIGISFEDAYRIAQDHERADAVIMSMFEESPLFIVSNSHYTHGACMVDCVEVLRDALKRMNAERVYIIPSSVHELLLIDADLVPDVQELEIMVKAVNADVLAINDILTNSVYLYEDHAPAIRRVA